jgi:hypothetical protein
MSLTAPVGTVVVLLLSVIASPLYAETKLTDFNGGWLGGGSDRSSPLEATQQTLCKMMNHADQEHMSSEIYCEGQAGLRKVLHLAITLEGDQITGSASQTSTPRGQRSEVLSGTVVGHKTDQIASLHVTFPGFTPSTTVLLTRTDPGSFTMQVTSLGFSLMDISFHRSKH